MSPVRALGEELAATYTVERELIGGGMSRVFVAHDERLERKVVIKLLPEQIAESLSVERFRREIRVAATLQHPNIVPVISAGETNGLPYLIMPYVDGESLRARLAQGPLTVVETVTILRDVARALAYAHERGIVHRDVKPDNILLSAGAAVVADFGVARAIQSARQDGEGMGPRSSTITAFGSTVGTPAYMAPEQIAAEGELDQRADIYSFGIMAYEMLSGNTPFHSRSHQSLLVAHLTERPRDLGALRPGVPAPLAQLVARCLEKPPDARPQSVREIITALEDPAMISGAFTTAGIGAVRTARGALARRAIAASLLVAALAAGGAALTLRGPQASPATAAMPAPTLAVLPLVYLGNDSLSFVAEGFASELTNVIGSVPGLRVASRSAVTRIHRMLNEGESVAGTVSLYLEGVIQREAGRVRVDARLVDASDGIMVWGESYEGQADSLFALQDAMSNSVATAVRTHLEERRGS